MKKQPKTVDAYINSAPKKVRSKLKKLRSLIKKVAPKAEERISYGMPYYGYKGRLVYFAYAKAHIGLYIPPPIIDEYESLLKGYKTTKSTVQFPLDGELPTPLIKKLVRARLKHNLAKNKP